MPFFHDFSRSNLRRVYVDAWRKHLESRPMEPLEAQIADVVAEHPEYQHWLRCEETSLERDWRPERGEANPFLHMGLHLAIREQVATDRPAGVREAFERLASRTGSAHEAEHLLLECLGTALWEAQRAGLPPDERAYLERILELSL